MRKRSSYKPKGVRLDVMGWLKQGMQPMATHQDAITLRLRNHAAMDELVKGRGTREHCDVVIAALNMTEALALMRIGEDWKDEIRAAQDALFAVGSRGAETGRFILRGPELTSLNLGMQIHDAQLEACTVAELERAIEMVRKIIISNRARPIVRKEKHEAKATD